MAIDFLTLGVSKEMDSILKQNGITEPTPIQEQAIPELMAGKDLIAQAQTGTGKTLAFILPIMEKINANNPFVQALIITPTRELALQITTETRKYIEGKNINLLAAYGGQDVEQQAKKLKGAVHIVVGTPGRLLDHLRRKTVNFSQIKFLVLDEADTMFDMGFLKEVEQIIHQTPYKRQTMLFSATMPKEIRMLTSKYMKEPMQIRIQSKNITLDEIKQLVIETTDRGKQDALCRIVDEFKPFMAIVFCRTKRRVSTLNEALQGKGYISDELHGDLTQGKREKVMKAFRKAELQLLVATDVAARGLDIEGVTHIFNYDIPQDAESYIHRIGRTGRAGQAGVAITFISPRDREDLDLIEKGIKMTIEKRKMSKAEEHEDGEALGMMREQKHKSYSKPRGMNNFSAKGFERSRSSSTGRSSSGKATEGRGGFRGKSTGTKTQNTSRPSRVSRP